MNKYISAIVLSTVGLSAAAEGILSKGKWEAGLVGGWGTSPTKETLVISTSPGLATSISRYKFTMKGNGLMGGVTLGYNIQRAKNIFGLSAGLYKDFYSTRNQGLTNDTLSHFPDTGKRDLKRKYTLELAGKFGRMVSEDIQVYGKLGALRSGFREQYSNIDGADLRHNHKGWGGVAGVGAQKTYNSLKVGLAYDYQYYQRLGSTMYHNIGATNYKNKSKIRPQYHNVFLTISKTF
jgi:hypothetical protein